MHYVTFLGRSLFVVSFFLFLNCFLTVLGKNKLKVSYFLTAFSVRRSSHVPSIKRQRGVNFRMARETIELCALVAFPFYSFPRGDVL